MGLELTAFRLFAPTFGYSIYVWGSLMAVILVTLSVGYALGGALADRAESDRPLFAVFLASGAWQALVLGGVHALLSRLAGLGEITGPAVATALVLAPSMGLLAVVGPFVVRLLARVDGVGTAAGRVYALGTLGGVAGILGTSFWLLPTFGTRTTLTVLLVLTVLPGVLGLVRAHPLAAVALLLPAAGPLGLDRPEPEETLWSVESPYNLVRVARHEGVTGLFLNAEVSLHSLQRPDGWTGRYWDDFALGPLLADAPREALVLGLGAGASLRPMWAAAPDLHVDGVEIDPAVIEAGERFFGLDPEDPRLDVHVADARPWLAAHPGPWDVVQVDLYHGGPYVPFYLATDEFYGEVAARLAPGGVLMLNVFDLGTPPDLLHAVAATLGRHFPTLLVLDRPGGNHTVFAFPRKLSLSAARRTLVEGEQRERKVRTMAERATRALRVLDPPEGAEAFTDDRAPVEELTRRMFVAGGVR